MEILTLALIAASVLGFGLVSAKAQKTIFTPPIVFVGVGWLLAEHGFGILDLNIEEHAIHTLAELTLVLVLFTDASRINLSQLRREHALPVRLLTIGLPLTIGLGALAAVWLFPHFTLWEAALLAAVLAPTDAALGQAVVSSPKVPVQIRQALNVESGLNDGIALPVVLLFLSACSAAVEGGGGASYWLRFAALQVTLGPLVGILVGWLGGRLVEKATVTGWMNQSFQNLASLGLAVLAFGGAELVGGNGFIAAFVAGLTLGNVTRHNCECLYEFAEAEGQLMTLLVFLVFGAAMVPEALAHAGWQTFLYAVLSLTVIRMLPVFLSLLGLKLRPATIGFLAWFGPRGIASILFGLLVVSESILGGGEEIFSVVLVTVLLSVLLHGITSYPGAVWYSKHTEKFSPEDAMELQPVPEMRVRIRHEG